MSEDQKELAKVIEKYFGADAGYLDIDCFTLARRIIEAGWLKPVRCKDCKHLKGEYCYLTLNYKWVGLNLNHYCSSGERRDEE